PPPREPYRLGVTSVVPTEPTSRLRSHSLTRMEKDHVKDRLHDAMHRGSHKATEEELAEVAAIVLAIVGEVTLELSAVIAELARRVEALEASPTT
ncbi:MAG: hypothetical protein M3256_14690, partial [Actinomycetota bacterium]|nr:hypothetical protein [Actinomycetota bacterium]